MKSDLVNWKIKFCLIFLFVFMYLVDELVNILHVELNSLVSAEKLRPHRLQVAAELTYQVIRLFQPLQQSLVFVFVRTARNWLL